MSLRNRQEFVRATRGMSYYLFDARSAHTEIFGQLASWAEAGWTIYVRSPTIDKDCLRELIHCTAQSDVRLCTRDLQREYHKQWRVSTWIRQHRMGEGIKLYDLWATEFGCNFVAAHAPGSDEALMLLTSASLTTQHLQPAWSRRAQRRTEMLLPLRLEAQLLQGCRKEG